MLYIYDIETLRSNLNMISKFKKLKMEIWICIYYIFIETNTALGIKKRLRWKSNKGRTRIIAF